MAAPSQQTAEQLNLKTAIDSHLSRTAVQQHPAELTLEYAQKHFMPMYSPSEITYFEELSESDVAMQRQTERAALETKAIEEILEICEERMEYFESLLTYLDETNDVKKICEELKKSNAPLPAEGRATKDELIELYTVLFKNYRILKQFLENNIHSNYNSIYLLESIYDAFYMQLEETGHGFKGQSKTDHRCDFIHWKKILTITQPFLSPEHEAYQKRHLGLHSTNMIQTIEKDLAFSKSLNTKIEGFLRRTAPYESTKHQGEIQSVQRVLRKLLFLSETLIESLTCCATSLADVLKKEDKKEKIRNFALYTAYHDRSIGAEKTNYLIDVEKKIFYSICWLEKELLPLEEIFLQLKKSETKNKSAKKNKSGKKKPAENFPIKSEEADLAVGKQEIPPAEGSKLAQHELKSKAENAKGEASKDRETIEEMRAASELQAYQKQKETELKCYRESVEEDKARKSAAVLERTRLLRRRFQKPAELPAQGLADHESEQLTVVEQQLKNRGEIFQSIFSAQPKVVFSQLKTLITRLNGEIIFVQSGSSHFKIILPNTHKKWEKTTHFNARIRTASPTGYTLKREDKTGKTSWYPHGEPHNDEVLSAYAAERCKEAFIKAGLTPERFEKLKCATGIDKKKMLA